MKRKHAEFLAAFKVVFVYQVRKKFGLSEDLRTVEKYVRPLLIPVYIVLLYFFTQNHYDIPLVLLMLAGCAWLSVIAMDSIRMIYQCRCTLAESSRGFREVEEFTFREKVLTYLIPAVVLTGIFAGGMFLITFFRTGELNAHVFIGMASIPFVLMYYLWMDCHLKLKRSMLHGERAK
ncbi:MAG: hypothetical protein JW878_04390 [Methanomicrobia archaeon]|nr:hypothetical protein [Methanomicrobia archaeon]